MVRIVGIGAGALRLPDCVDVVIQAQAVRGRLVRIAGEAVEAVVEREQLRPAHSRSSLAVEPDLADEGQGTVALPAHRPGLVLRPEGRPPEVAFHGTQAFEVRGFHPQPQGRQGLPPQPFLQFGKAGRTVLGLLPPPTR